MLAKRMATAAVAGAVVRIAAAAADDACHSRILVPLFALVPTSLNGLSIGKLLLRTQAERWLRERPEMTFRYIGSKARIVSQIMNRLGPPQPGQGRFVDLFCGTGAVAEAASKSGWATHINDHLHCAVVMATARMLGRGNVTFESLGGYEGVIEALNGLKGESGFVFSAYSPASSTSIGFERRYFTSDNAARIDAMRRRIREWKAEGKISDCEERLLLADLLSAANRVANIAGTYGCFLSKWQKQALAPIELKARCLAPGLADITFSVQEASALRTSRADVVYLDPPYTKRQYAAYYHLLETITLGDEPEVEGVAGLRPWRAKASEFCYRTRALQAFSDIIGALDADRILISYSDNAHLSIDALTDAVSSFGRASPVLLTEIGRYRPNISATSGAATVNEYLIELQKTAIRAAA